MLRGHSLLPWCAGLLIAMHFGVAPAAAAEPYDPWPGLAQDIFNSRVMNDGAGVIAIDKPVRAEDAAIVPVTRVRVNNYTDVHAVAELSDGQLYVTKTYVKASGGCSAPAAKNAEEAKGRLGQMRFRQFAKPGEGPASGAREAQIMIGHPNNSGLQMDQVTQLYIPAFFVNELRVWQDDSLVLAMEGGISISEDPNIRFTYVPNGAKRFRVEAKDTEGHVFQNEWKVEGSGI
jgi:sulfur-oxidizing protein SoxY